MTVYLVGAGPGDPRLITVYGADLLGRADVVVHDRLVAAALLDRVRPDAVVVDVGKRPGAAHRQEDINALLVSYGRTGACVVRLKGGDPFVFGRGGEEVEALQAAGVPVEVVPGVTAAFAAPASVGVPVTHRGLSTSVTVVTGHVGDRSAPGGVDWAALAAAGGTLVVLMGMENRAAIAAALLAGGRSPATPVRIVHWGTTAHQRSIRTTLGELGHTDMAPPATMVIGAVADLQFGSVEDRPLHGACVVVTRPRQRAGDLVAALEADGADVIQLPLVAVAPAADGGAALGRALARIGCYQWVVFTSVVAVDRVMAEIRDSRDLAGVQLAAVGPATAAALGRYGLRADVVADRATGAGLAEAMDVPVHGPRVLYPRAAGADRGLAEGLTAKGWVVDAVEAYQTVPVADVDLPAGALEAAMSADVVIVASPSAAARYAELTMVAAGDPAMPPDSPGPARPAGRGAARRLESARGAGAGSGSGSGPAPVICIGPTTAAAARRLGLEVAAVSAAPGVEELAAAVRTWWCARSGDSEP